MPPSLSARQQRILDWLRAGGSLSIQTLAHRLQVSGETVRRDVQGLVDAALVQRFHGGVRLHRSLQESPFEQRLRTQVAAKRQLAQAVAALVPDGASLALDNSSTACFVAQALAARRKLTVFTPSLEVARALVSAQAGHTVLMPGGVLRATDMTLTGAAALRYAAQLRPDCFVLSVAGVSEAGCLDFDPFEVEYKQCVSAQARHVVVAVDASKFAGEGLMTSLRWKEVHTLVTDAPPPAAIARAAAELRQVVCAG